MSDINIGAGNSTVTIGQVIQTLQQPEFYLNFKYGHEIVQAFALVLLIVGFTFIFFGVRLFKYVLFLLSFWVFGGLTYFIAVILGHDPDKALIAAVVVGLVFGLILLKVWKLSLFVCGATVGFLLWLGFISIFPHLLTSDAARYTVLAIPCIICGLLAVKMEKVWLLLATPIVGAFLGGQGLDFYIKQNLNVFDILSGNTNCSSEKCFYIYGGLFGTALIGFLVQWRYTSGLYNPEKVRYVNKEDEEVEEVPTVVRRKKKIKRVVYIDDDEEDQVPAIPFTQMKKNSTSSQV